ncbi:MAG: bacterioferritin-associated ferredoxin [Qingshengfaniella sp.]
MIVCHCQNISDRDIHAAIDWMRASDKTAIVTAGKIYRALGKRAECGGCMALFVVSMRSNPNLIVPENLRNLRSLTSKEMVNERRPSGH